jgi:hypothetical protein
MPLHRKSVENLVRIVLVPQFVNLLFDNGCCVGLEPVFTKRGIVMVRSLKSGVAEFVEQTPLSFQQKSQLKVFIDVDLFCIRYHLSL